MKSLICLNPDCEIECAGSYCRDLCMRLHRSQKIANKRAKQEARRRPENHNPSLRKPLNRQDRERLDRRAEKIHNVSPYTKNNRVQIKDNFGGLF